MEETSIDLITMPAWLEAVFWIVYLLMGVIIIMSIVAIWRLFQKANKHGWASIIPIYNTIVYTQISGRPTWWVLLLFIPFVNIAIGLIISYDFVRAYGKGTGFFVGTLFLPFIFYLILAFDDSQYVGINNTQGQGTMPQPPQTPPTMPQPPQTPPPPQNPPLQ